MDDIFKAETGLDDDDDEDDGDGTFFALAIPLEH